MFEPSRPFGASPRPFLSRDIVAAVASEPWQIAAYYRLRHEIFLREQALFDSSDLDAHDAHAIPIVALPQSARERAWEGRVKLDATLSTLAAELAARTELDHKRDIQLAARAFGKAARSSWLSPATEIVNGDDAAAIRGPDGRYVLLAA